VAPQTKAAFDEIAQEQLARNIAFLGQDRVEKIKGSFVIIVGLGGVGKKKRKKKKKKKKKKTFPFDIFFFFDF